MTGFVRPLLVSLLVALAAWGARAAPSASSPDDDAIYDRVRQRLYNDPDVKGYNITIEVKNGVVTLNGTVASEKIRNKAEKLSRKVSGVKQVVNKLEVGEEKPAPHGEGTMKRTKKTREDLAAYYDRRRVLGELEERPVVFALNEELRARIQTGQTRRRLQNVSIKLDPVHVIALRKIAAMKSIPYQTLIRLWLAECIRRELRFSER